MLGADEPASTRISSMVALPVRSSSLIISSERRLIESDMSSEFFLSAARASKVSGVFSQDFAPIFQESFKKLIDLTRYDHIRRLTCLARICSRDRKHAEFCARDVEGNL